jgi:hypothetical protein
VTPEEHIAIIRNSGEHIKGYREEQARVFVYSHTSIRNAQGAIAPLLSPMCEQCRQAPSVRRFGGLQQFSFTVTCDSPECNAAAIRQIERANGVVTPTFKSHSDEIKWLREQREQS